MPRCGQRGGTPGSTGCISGTLPVRHGGRLGAKALGEHFDHRHVAGPRRKHFRCHAMPYRTTIGPGAVCWRLYEHLVRPDRAPTFDIDVPHLGLAAGPAGNRSQQPGVAERWDPGGGGA